jgi:pimeloyl-ACP methyl ester carboxylesterase
MDELRAASECDRLHAGLLQIFCRLLQIADLSIDDDFFDKGGDSLLATELVVELRQLTGRAIPETLLFEAATIRALAERLGEGLALQLKPAVRIGAPSGSATPLVFFHGDWSDGGYYVEDLARRLAPEVPLIVVAPPGMGDERFPRSIEDMAAERLPAILEIQPTGPYRLGGHCAGSIVALETARLLLARGDQVEIVAMIDPPAVSYQVSEMADDKIWQAYDERLAIYRPTPLAVPLALFMSEQDPEPWCHLSGQCELFEAPGGHFDWITIRAAALAEMLKKCLSRERGPRALHIARSPE